MWVAVMRAPLIVILWRDESGADVDVIDSDDDGMRGSDDVPLVFAPDANNGMHVRTVISSSEVNDIVNFRF